MFSSGLPYDAGCGVLGGAKTCLRCLQLSKVQTASTCDNLVPATRTAMTFSKAYVPSRALLRALLRPQPPSCPFTRPLATPFVRGKRTKATKPDKVDKPPFTIDMKQVDEIIAGAEEEERSLKWLETPTDEELEDPNIPPITWYEQDLDKGTPRRLIERIATPEDRKKHVQMVRMIEESDRNPNYDDAELNRRLIDSLISNPNFAHLTEELKEMKEDIYSKEELAQLEADAQKDLERESQELKANLRMATYQAIQELQNDPDAVAAKEDLQQVLDNMPETENMDEPEFQAMLNKAMIKLNDDPRFQKKLAAMTDEIVEEEAKFKEKWDGMEKEMDEELREFEDDNVEVDATAKPAEDDGDMDSLLHQMRDIMKSIGGDSSVEAELDALLKEDPLDPSVQPEGVFEREMDFEELAMELEKMAKAQLPRIKEEMAVPADLQAKVDKIMADPKLMEKLVYIQGLIADAEHAKSDMTNIAHETAPDPYELEETRTTTLRQRMEAARGDPEHTAALGRLRVALKPPFNISPALKSFNQAIELAYIGANDDIRRILWRSYQKARGLPTFLQNVSDDAWDILYYSQAVTWGANQNRQAHLRMLLADLKSLGMDGPPTHPSTLVQNGDGEHLETQGAMR
jgi:hypothetical protein